MKSSMQQPCARLEQTHSRANDPNARDDMRMRDRRRGWPRCAARSVAEEALSCATLYAWRAKALAEGRLKPDSDEGPRGPEVARKVRRGADGGRSRRSGRLPGPGIHQLGRPAPGLALSHRLAAGPAKELFYRLYLNHDLFSSAGRPGRRRAASEPALPKAPRSGRPAKRANSSRVPHSEQSVVRIFSDERPLAKKGRGSTRRLIGDAPIWGSWACYLLDGNRFSYDFCKC